MRSALLAAMVAVFPAALGAPAGAVGVWMQAVAVNWSVEIVCAPVQ